MGLKTLWQKIASTYTGKLSEKQIMSPTPETLKELLEQGGGRQQSLLSVGLCKSVWMGQDRNSIYIM